MVPLHLLIRSMIKVPAGQCWAGLFVFYADPAALVGNQALVGNRLVSQRLQNVDAYRLL